MHIREVLCEGSLSAKSGADVQEHDIRLRSRGELAKDNDAQWMRIRVNHAVVR
jgi:hypothetical protein